MALVLEALRASDEPARVRLREDFYSAYRGLTRAERALRIESSRYASPQSAGGTATLLGRSASAYAAACARTRELWRLVIAGGFDTGLLDAARESIGAGSQLIGQAIHELETGSAM
ncbi:MAG: hypothetical protein U1F11_02760 [Steroidobacteraceae bacterium]